MREALRQWQASAFPLVILGTLTLLTFWLKATSELPAPRGKGELRHDPDTIIEDLRAQTVNAQGMPLFELRASRLTHYPDDDSTHLELPQLRYTPQADTLLQVAGKTGLAFGRGTSIQLSQGVTVERRVRNSQQPVWRAELEEITALPEEGRAFSTTPFIFTQGAARIEGKGLTLDQGQRVLILESRVWATFPPRTAAPRT